MQSVTEEEVKNGILHNSKAVGQSLLIDREYTDLPFSEPSARDFVDMAGKIHYISKIK